MGPWSILTSTTAIFAADSMARRLGVTGRRRAVLAVAVACALWALGNAGERRWRRCGWLLDAGIALQPAVVLVVPLLATAIYRDAPAGTDPGTGLEPAAETGSTSDTTGHTKHSGSPPSSRRGPAQLPDRRPPDTVDRPGTPPERHRRRHWTAPTGKRGRSRRGRHSRRANGPTHARRLCWAAAGAFACWTLFEPVMVFYYLAPAALVAATLPAPRLVHIGTRLVGAVAVSVVLAWFSLRYLAGDWSWWLVVVALTAILLALSWLGPLWPDQEHHPDRRPPPSPLCVGTGTNG